MPSGLAGIALAVRRHRLALSRFHISAGSPVSPKSLVGGPSGPMLSSQIASSLCRAGSKKHRAEAPPTKDFALAIYLAPDQSSTRMAGADRD
ncbi:DUF6053 domain-containing protein [Lysobacter capsici]|uniref:DUF6053 domain-containing protein n=1 Tax=Lysobacter capsici TaxID=435897 RepID=UPI003D2F86DF